MDFSRYRSNSLLVVHIFVKDLYLAKTAIDECFVEKIGLYWIMQIQYNPTSKEERLTIMKKLDDQDNVISVELRETLIIVEFIANKSKDLTITSRISCGYDSLIADDIVEIVLYWKTVSYDIIKCLKQKAQAVNDSPGLFFNFYLISLLDVHNIFASFQEQQIVL